MTKAFILVVGCFALAGLFLLGNGLTGYATAQSCCFGPSCPADYRCNISQPSPQVPESAVSSLNAYIGSMFLVASVILGVGYYVVKEATL